MKRLAGLLVVTLSTLGSGSSLAADATVSWTHPTQRVDGTALAVTDIRETQVDWARCATGNVFPPTVAGTKVVPSPATTTQVIGLDYGTWCFRARTAAVVGGTSDNSAVYWKQYLAPPRPPVFTTVDIVAYEIRLNPGRGMVLGKAVGTVALGTECGAIAITEQGWREYHEVPLDIVNLEVMPESAIVVVQCEVT